MNSPARLVEQWEALKSEQPQLRIRNAAATLGVSEVELLATSIGKSVTRLRNEPKEILKEIESLGKVMALTRNDSCVHERKGVYDKPGINKSPVGLFTGVDIDLRIFFEHWHSAFAVTEMARGKERNSLQFFGKDGLAIHKIYLVPQSNVQAFQELVEKYKHSNQDPVETVSPVEDQKTYKQDEEVDVPGFQKAWLNMQDTHQFFGMLTKYEVSRVQALRLAPDTYHAALLDNSKIVKLLEMAAAKEVPIMAFVGNRGNIQIHSGPIKKTLWHENWYNVLDPDFNLHLNMDDVAQTWVVRKPTTDGVVTSVEVFDEQEELIVQFFGARKPGIPELPEWQKIVQELQSL